MVIAGFACDGGFGSPDTEDSGGTEFPEPPKSGVTLRSWPECLTVGVITLSLEGTVQVEILCGMPCLLLWSLQAMACQAFYTLK